MQKIIQTDCRFEDRSLGYLSNNASTIGSVMVAIHTLQFSLNVFFTEFSGKKYFILRRLRTCHIMYKRPRCYHSTSKTQAAERIFKLSLIHA